MRKKLSIFLFITMIASSFLVGRGNAAPTDLFLKANEAYRSGNYEKALERYNELAKEAPGAEVYYNMANADFKLNHIGQAILNYERARKLNPRERDIVYNLNYARTFLEYKIEDKRNWYSKEILDLLEYVQLKECALVLAFVCFLLLLSVVLHLYVKKRFELGRVGVLLLTFFVVAAILSSVKFHQTYFQKKAVVIARKIDVRFGPSDEDKLAFSLAEGIEVKVDEQSNDWYRLTLVSGESGWAPKNGIVIV